MLLNSLFRLASEEGLVAFCVQNFSAKSKKALAKTIAEALESRKVDTLQHLLPAGKIQGHEYVVGSLSGEEGESLKVHLNGKGAVWADFATGDKGGDLLDLWAAVRCSGGLKAAMREAAQWLGMPGNGKKTHAKARPERETSQNGPKEGLPK